MGLIDSFREVSGKKPEEEKRNQQPAQSGLLAAYRAEQGTGGQAPATASVMDYDSLLLPTPGYTPRVVRMREEMQTQPAAAAQPQTARRDNHDRYHDGTVTETPTARVRRETQESKQVREKTQTEAVATDGVTRPTVGPGGGGRGRKTEEELRKEQREAAAYARAVQPTSDMYLHPVTAAAAEEQQMQADAAWARAEERGKQAEASRSEIDKQRDEVKAAEREAAAMQPTSDMYLHPATAATAEAQQKMADEAWERREEGNRKLHEMGGRYGLAEDALTVLENLGAGAVSAVRGFGNALGYMGQLQARTAMMSADPYLRMWGQDWIADANAEAVKQMREEGLQPLSEVLEDAGVHGAAAVDKSIRDFAQTAAEHTQASGKVTRALANTANGVGGMVPSVLANVAFPGSGLWIMAGQAFGNATEEALNAGASDEKAVLYGGAVAAVEVLTEKMFGGIPGLNIGSLDDAVENAIKKNVGSETAQRAILFLVDALGEGAEEFISEFADWGLNYWLVGDDNRTLREVNKDAWYSAFIGALTSVTMSAPAEVIKNMSPKELARRVAQEMETRMETERKAAQAEQEADQAASLELPKVGTETENAARGRAAEELALPDPAKVAGNTETAQETGADLRIVERPEGFYFEKSGVMSGPFASEQQARNWESFGLPDLRQENAMTSASDSAENDGAKVRGTIIPEEGPAKSQRAKDTETVTKKLGEAAPQLKEMQPVATLNGTEVPKTGRATDRALAYLKTIGMKVFRNGFGEVLFSRNNVKGGLIGHGISDAKVDMMAAVPSVIANGVQIDYQPNWSGRLWDAYVFAGPVVYKGKLTYLAAVVAKDNTSNRYYLHQVVDETGNVVFDSNEEAPDAAVDGRSVHQDDLRTVSRSDASENTVPQAAQEVKNDLALPAVPTQEQAEAAQPRDLSLPAAEEAAKGTQTQEQAEERDLSLPEVPAEAQPEAKPLPTPQEYADRNAQRAADMEDDSWRREETLQEEQARREAEEQEYLQARAEEDAERAYAQAEREGKQMERTVPPKAPRSRAELKRRVQELFSIRGGSKARVNEIVDAIADDIQNGREISEARMEQLFDAIYEKGNYTRAGEEYFRNFRSTVNGTKIYVSPEVRAEFGEDWKRFASRARKAGIRLTGDISDGGIDVHAAELAGIYTQLDTEAHPAQQLEQIVEYAERGGPQTLTQAEMEDVLRGEWGSEAVQERIDDMERSFRQLLDVFAQSAETEAGVRAAADEKIRKAKESAAELAKRQMERKALRELQEKTLKQLQWLSRNRNRTDAEMRARFDDVLRNIDTIAANTANALHVDKESGKTWRELADLYKKAKESDPNFMPSKRLDDIVMRLDGDKIGEMDYDALQDLYKAAIGLRTEYYNRNNVINDELGRTFADAYHASVDEFRGVRGTPKGETKASRWFNREQLTPMNYLRHLVGWKKGSTFASFAQQLESGERAYKKYVVDATKSLERVLKKNADWARRADGQGKDAIWYEYEIPKEFTRNGIGEAPTYSGETVKVWMTPAQKVHLALECENYDNLRHMEGGRTFADRELYSKGKRAEAFAKGTTVKMTPEWARRISGDLTPEEQALKDALSRYYNEYAKGEINRVSNILYGYDRAMGGKYAPIFTNDNYVGHQAGISDTTAEGVGHLKARQVSGNPSYNIGAFEAFERHADQTARFVGYSIPVRNMETLMNWRGKDTTLRDEITHKWGKDSGTAYIDKLLTNLQTTRYNEEGAVEGLTNSILSNYVNAVFGANPGLVLKQNASFPQVAAVLGYRTMPTPKQLLTADRGLIGKYTPELDYRQLGYATPETAQLKNNPGLMQRNRALNFIFGGGAITWMDGLTVQSIWPWAENYVRQNFPNLQKGTQEQIDAGESPFYQKVAEVFNEAVSTTQPMYDTMHRAAIMQDGNGVTRAFTMFKTVPLQQYNTLRQAFGELQAAREGGDPAERKAAARKTANAVTATLGSVAALEAVELLNQAWKNGLKGYRDDDDELTAESAGKKIAERSIKDLAGMVIGGSELSDLVFNIINGKKWYGIEIPGGEQLNDVIETFADAGKAAAKFVEDGISILRNGGDLGEYYRTHGGEYVNSLKEIAEKFAMYFKGLPVENVEKYLGGALRIAAPELYAQVQDMLETPDRAAMKKTGEELLPTRMQDMMETRMGGSIPERSAEELARLYQEYGSVVALPDVPTSITVRRDDDTSEEITLDAWQTQTYEQAFREAARSSLAGFGNDGELQGLDDDAKVDFLKRLYAVAGDYAKSTVIEDYQGNYTEKIQALLDAGIPLGSVMRAMAMQAALPDAQFAAWVESGVFRGRTLDTVKDVLNVRTTYDALKATGLDDEAIFTVADALDALKPEEKGGSVSKWQRLEAISGLDLPQEKIDKAASAYLTEGQYEAWQASGMELGEYADAMAKGTRINNSAEGVKDDDGETVRGSKQLEVMMGVNSLDLKPQQKSALMQSMGYNEKEPIWYTRYSDDDYEAYYYMSDSRRKAYKDKASWLSPSEFAECIRIDDEAKGRKDASGETVSGSKKLEVMQGIDEMSLAPQKKTQIMEALGYDMDGDGKAPPIWDTDYSGKDYEAYYYMSDGQRTTYKQYCGWMPVTDFVQYADSCEAFHDIKNNSGKTVVSRKEQVIAYIDALDLLDDQKTALYVAMGYNKAMTDKGFEDCPWWDSLQLRTQYYPK